MGAALLAIRFLQLRTGFDPATGLAVDSPLHNALPAAAALFSLIVILRRRKAGTGTPAAADIFAAPEKELMLLVAGCMAMAAGGGLLTAQSLSGGIALVGAVAGVTTIAAALGLLALVRKLRKGEEFYLLYVLPVLFSSVFVVLAAYLPFATDPILRRFWLVILAAAMASFAFAQLSGFFRRESRPRRFLTVSGLAIVLCIGALGDMTPLGLRVILAGCAVTLGGFSLLLKAE